MENLKKWGPSLVFVIIIVSAILFLSPQFRGDVIRYLSF
jgi:hypothetical protein